jgi:hypothetical protein
MMHIDEIRRPYVRCPLYFVKVNNVPMGRINPPLREAPA